MKFAFIIHPLHAKQAANKYPILKFLPDSVIEMILRAKSPIVASQVTGIKSITGTPLEGVFIGCPLTPRQMVADPDFATKRIIECAALAEKEGAGIIGLGAFTSVVGDGGITVAKNSNIAVTTGNSYTVATAIEGTMKAAGLVGVIPSEATLAVIGATGSIGKTCAEVMSPQFKNTILVGRDMARTEAILPRMTRAHATVDVTETLQADVVVTVTSAESAVILPEHLRQGAVVCDVSRPRDVSVRVAQERPDVLCIEGGMVTVPGNPEFGIYFGFPPGKAYACMSETMMLALEDRRENFTLGKEVSVDQVDEMNRLADKHGFTIDGFRSFEKAVDEATIQRTRDARAKTHVHA